MHPRLKAGHSWAAWGGSLRRPESPGGVAAQAFKPGQPVSGLGYPAHKLAKARLDNSKLVLGHTQDLLERGFIVAPVQDVARVTDKLFRAYWHVKR